MSVPPYPSSPNTTGSVVINVDQVVNMLNVNPATISGSMPNRTFTLFETAIYEPTVLAWITYAMNYIHPLVSDSIWKTSDPLTIGLLQNALVNYSTYMVLTFLLPAVPVAFFDYKLGPLSKRRTDAAEKALQAAIQIYRQRSIETFTLLTPMSLDWNTEPLHLSSTSPPVGI